MKLVAVLILAAVFISGCTSTSPAVQSLYTEIQSNVQPSYQNQSASDQQSSTGYNDFGPCAGSGTVMFDSSPLKPEDINYIDPQGSVHASGGHVTPIDHQYWVPLTSSEDSAPYNVYAPAAGRIVDIQHMTQFIGEPGPNNPKVDDYRFIISHKCDLVSIFIHVKELSPRIMSITGQISGSRQVSIPVEGGEVVGKVGRSFDFSVHDYKVTLSGFIVPLHYSREPWKIHTVDPFDYFKEPLRSQLVAKDLRSAQPLGGKIDYDIDGRLIGNWFKEGTNGYQGVDQQRYWESHLSFLYDSVDPSEIVISTGDFGGTADSFGIKGNSPDPASVGAASGLIKYELVHYDFYKDGQQWNTYQKGFAKNLKVVNQNDIQGTMIVQMISDRKTKVEMFVGKTASQVSGFDSNAIVYER